MDKVQFSDLSEADLDRLEKQGGELIVVREGHEPMVMVRLADWQNMDDTQYLLSDPINREMLLRSIAQLEAGKGIERELIEPRVSEG